MRCRADEGPLWYDSSVVLLFTSNDVEDEITIGRLGGGVVEVGLDDSPLKLEPSPAAENDSSSAEFVESRDDIELEVE